MQEKILNDLAVDYYIENIQGEPITDDMALNCYKAGYKQALQDKDVKDVLTSAPADFLKSIEGYIEEWMWNYNRFSHTKDPLANIAERMVEPKEALLNFLNLYKEKNNFKENWPQKAKEENRIIRQWKDVKFGHNEEVVCIQEYIQESKIADEYIDDYMGKDLYDPKAHITPGKKYKIFEAFYNKQVYVFNNKGLRFWYSEDLFEKI